MIEYIKNNKSIIITFLLVIAFIFFASQQKSSDISSDNFYLVDSDSVMSKGDKSAPVSIIQYSDFLCPSCSYFSTQIMPVIDRDYIETGKVKFEFRPMAFIAEGSTVSDEGAFCAVEQDKFWEYHDIIYNFVADSVFNKNLDPKSDIILTNEIVKQSVTFLELDEEKFNNCLDSNKYYSDVVEYTNKANQDGINSTPYIIVNGQKYLGEISLEAFETLIKTQL